MKIIEVYNIINLGSFCHCSIGTLITDDICSGSSIPILIGYIFSLNIYNQNMRYIQLCIHALNWETGPWKRPNNHQLHFPRKAKVTVSHCHFKDERYLQVVQAAAV